MKRFKTSAMPSSICRASLFLTVFFFCCLFSACSDDSDVLEPERRNEWRFVKGNINGEPLMIGTDDIMSEIEEYGIIDTCNIRTVNASYWQTAACIKKGKNIFLNIGFPLPISEGTYTLNFSKGDSIDIDPRLPFACFTRYMRAIYFPSETPATMHIDHVYYKEWSELPFVIGRLEGKFIKYDDPTDVIYLEDVEFQIH